MAQPVLSQAELQEKIKRINAIVAEFDKEISEIKHKKKEIIIAALEQIKHEKIHRLLQEINNNNDQDQKK